MSQERDTHFAGFAKLLLHELETKYDHLPLGEWGPAEKDQLIIAQRAYDLAVHILDSVRWTGVPRYINQDIPDLTEWPVEPPQTT